MEPHPHQVGGPETIQEVLARYEADGYTGHFGSRPGGMVVCFTCRQESPATEVCLDAVERLEGTSDPADMLAVAAVRCPRCDARGTLVLNYGPEASLEDDEVFGLLKDMRRGQG